MLTFHSPSCARMSNLGGRGNKINAKACQACGFMRRRSEFTNNQWRHTDRMRCSACTEARLLSTDDSRARAILSQREHDATNGEGGFKPGSAEARAFEANKKARAEAQQTDEPRTLPQAEEFHAQWLQGASDSESDGEVESRIDRSRCQDYEMAEAAADAMLEHDQLEADLLVSPPPRTPPPPRIYPPSPQPPSQEPESDGEVESRIIRSLCMDYEMAEAAAEARLEHDQLEADLLVSPLPPTPPPPSTHPPPSPPRTRFSPPPPPQPQPHHQDPEYFSFPPHLQMQSCVTPTRPNAQRSPDAAGQRRLAGESGSIDPRRSAAATMRGDQRRSAAATIRGAPRVPPPAVLSPVRRPQAGERRGAPGNGTPAPEEQLSPRRRPRTEQRTPV